MCALTLNMSPRISQRERRYEPRERARIAALERSIARQNAIKEAEERDRVEMQARLDVWDDDESDELFYVDRCVDLVFVDTFLLMQCHC